MIKEYNFILKYKLPTTIEPVDALVDQLYAQGCDDALIGIGVTGQIALEFVREAASAVEAVQSAHKDVLNTLPQAQLIEASPDYVGLTDIAEIVSVTRQQMRKIYEQESSFPAPFHSGKNAIWHLHDVLDWIKANKNYAICEQVHQLSMVTAKLNTANTNKQDTSFLFERFKKNTLVLYATAQTTNSLFTSEQNVCLSALEVA